MAAAQQGSGGGQGGDNSLNFLWGIVLIVAAALVIWYFGKVYISSAVYQVRLYELIGINATLQAWDDVMLALHVPWLAPRDVLLGTMRKIRAGSLPVDFESVHMISALVGEYLRYPISIILLILAYVVYNKNIVQQFQRTFSMKKLLQTQKANWPQIMPIADIDLVQEDIEKGPWAMAPTPLRFAKQHNLIEKKRAAGKLDATLIRTRAHKVFALQVGSLWHGADALPIHKKALYAAFAAIANRDRKRADVLLQQISRSSASGKLDFSGAQALLDLYKNTKIVAMASSRHAYVMTVMASMLELARTDGVVACSLFLWLKPLDRALWYMCNSVGRRTAVADVAGPFAHWLAENALNHPIQTPMVEEAVNGLALSLTEIVYDPDEDPVEDKK